MAQEKKPNMGLRWFSLLAVLGTAVGVGLFFFLQKEAAPGGGEPQPLPVNTGPISSSPTTGITAMEEANEPFFIRLSEGQPLPQVSQQTPPTDGEPLTEAEIAQILARLPDLPAAQPSDFRLAQDPIPPPRTGETIEAPFPPPEPVVGGEAVESGPLEVLRFSPEGEIPTAPFVSLTFNQPMVPLATLEQLRDMDVPAQIVPPLPGTWRWLGTRTLTFQYDSELIDRLPKATEYRVTVPAGVRSASGAALETSVSWAFRTPPLRIAASYPNDAPQPLDTLIFIAFDQRIDPSAVLGSLEAAVNGRAVSLRLASDAEIEGHKEVSRLVKDSLPGRWMALRPAEALPADAAVQVTVRRGAPSAEGPLTTTDDQSFSFRTYAPLRVLEHGCAWYGEKECPPLTPLFIRFNNPIDLAAYQPEMLRISPEIPGAFIDIQYDRIEIRGATTGNTTYTVLVDAALQDIFGQRLGSEARLTFKVGRAEPRLFGSEKTFVTLDPMAEKPVFSVYAINYSSLNVKIYAVQPSDWPAFQLFLQEYSRTNQPSNPPGQLVSDRSVTVSAAPDRLIEVPIDLNPYTNQGFGHFIVLVEPPRGLFSENRYWQNVRAWVQVTQIGLDAISDHSEIRAWATSLQDGKPLEGATVQVNNLSSEALTGADGLAQMQMPETKWEEPGYLSARLGSDSALLPRGDSYWGGYAWHREEMVDRLLWYVFDDRQMYRPGEELHLKGWVRRMGARQNGDTGLVGAGLTSVSYIITGPQGNELGRGSAQASALGGFDFAFQIPAQTNLGGATIELRPIGSLSGVDSASHYHYFQIQEFRRPEFEVLARNETPGPYFAGEEAVVAVEAKYYAGDPLPNAEVNWLVSYTRASYAPPNWPDFTFGRWTPWWIFRGWDFPGGETTQETFSGQTDASGTHYLALDFTGQTDGSPVSVTAEGTVMDVNRQAWTGATNLLVHPADLYVGLRSERYFVERGRPLEIEVIVTDLDGNPVPGRAVDVSAARLEWTLKNGTWEEVEIDRQICSPVSALEPVVCAFETPIGGSYRIRAAVVDDQGRENVTELTRWVSGGERPPSRKVEQESVTLVPDQESYQPGDVAQVLVQSPFSPAEGLLTVARSGILSTRSFHIEEGSYTLEIPIEEAHIPNLHIQVDLVGAAPRTGDDGESLAGIPPRPAFASGSLKLSVPPLQRTLAVELNLVAAELAPGGETILNLRVTDASGQPAAGAEAAVVIVDEAVLALSNYQMWDPLGVFYPERPAWLSSLYGRSSIILIDPLELASDGSVEKEEAMLQRGLASEASAPAAAPQAPMPTMTFGDTAAGSAPQPIQVRTNFNPLAVFAAAVQTGPDGSAAVPVKLPDNLTRYRVMVVVVDESGRSFGQAETNLTARLPLMVRPSAPRFLNFGDRFELPVVLQNQTGSEMTVEIVVRATNLDLGENPGRRVSIPARDRVEVRFPASTLQAGTATIQVAAVTNVFADAALISLPVYTPATTEAFATYGVLDQGSVLQPLASPSGVFPQYGGLEINTSSTALQALTDAVLYLVTYPYDSVEPIASRILAAAALHDVLSAFEAEGLPAPEEINRVVQEDIDRLAGFQNADGGFPYWRRGHDSIPFNSIHVLHALHRAELMGFSVPPTMKQQALAYVRNIEQHYPAEYGPEIRQILSAYALNVRHKLGDRDHQKALRLFNELNSGGSLDAAPLEAVGWLWPVLQDAPGAENQLAAIRRHIGNRVIETPGAANFTTQYNEQAYLLYSSDRRTDGILLEALMIDNPAHDLIPKLVNGLLAHRVKGRWNNTQENVFILLSLDRYFNTYEAVEPDFVARIWLGENYAGEHAFRGRTTDRSEIGIPMAYLMDEAGPGETQNLVISKEGPGRLYYRLGLRYAPTNLELPPVDMGFVVQRSYEAVDDPADVGRDENGAWVFRAGARVRVRLSMVADNRRYHVALVDPLPAGLEIINPDLAVSGGLPPDPSARQEGSHWWWWWTWYQHQNLRDERAEAFTSFLWEGVHEYTYVARATTPGVFVVPPAKAEEMYSPEVFGRSSSDVVIVK